MLILVLDDESHCPTLQPNVDQYRRAGRCSGIVDGGALHDVRGLFVLWASYHRLWLRLPMVMVTD